MATETVPAAGPADAEGAMPTENRFGEAHRRMLNGAIGLAAVRCTEEPNATAVDLANDFGCLFGAAVGALETMTDSAATDDAPQEVSEPW